MALKVFLVFHPLGAFLSVRFFLESLIASCTLGIRGFSRAADVNSLGR